MFSQQSERHFGLLQQHISQQQTVPYPAVSADAEPSDDHPRIVSPNYHPHTPPPDLNETIFIPFLDPSPDNTRELVSLDTRLLIQANSGGGKSWLIRRLLEQSHGKVQQ